MEGHEAAQFYLHLYPWGNDIMDSGYAGKWVQFRSTYNADKDSSIVEVTLVLDKISETSSLRECWESKSLN